MIRSFARLNILSKNAFKNLNSSRQISNQPKKPSNPLPPRPLNMENAQFTKVIETNEGFEFVKKLIPSQIVPEPPKHESYPTPSGWVPPNIEKSSKLPYFVLRTRFHNFPIYPLEREGGSRKLVRIRHIEGDIWV